MPTVNINGCQSPSPTMEDGQSSPSGWSKAEMVDDVQIRRILAEIETDKATMEVESSMRATAGKNRIVAAGTDDNQAAVNRALIAILDLPRVKTSQRCVRSNFGAIIAPTAAQAPSRVALPKRPSRFARTGSESLWPQVAAAAQSDYLDGRRPKSSGACTAAVCANFFAARPAVIAEQCRPCRHLSAMRSR